MKLLKGEDIRRGFHRFTLMERGKLREISGVHISERVVQRSLCDNALVPVLTRTCISDNMACIKGKGTHAAIKRVAYFLREYYRKTGSNEGYVVLVDFSNFFGNMKHWHIRKILEDHFTDKDMIEFIMLFVDAFGEVGCGLGSQVPQIIGTVYASKADHYAKEVLRIHEYIKYMDDTFDGSVKKIAQNMLLVQTETKAKDQNMAEIEVLTEYGNVIARYEGFETVYKELDDGMILSNDGTVYVEQPEQKPDVDQIRIAKLAEVSSRCESTIFEGVDVELTDGSVEHVSLTEKDQINLFGKQSQLAAGATQLEYHEDGKLCKYYSAEDMTKIIEAAMKFVSYHTTYCNSINAWIKGAQTAEEIEAIQYGAQIPDEYKSKVLKDYETAMGACKA